MNRMHSRQKSIASQNSGDKASYYGCEEYDDV